MTILETCSCGARLEFTSNRNVAGLDVAHVQQKFHKNHAKCRVKPTHTKLPQSGSKGDVK